MYKTHLVRSLLVHVLASNGELDILNNIEPYQQLDVDPQRDDDASPMSTNRCMLSPT